MWALRCLISPKNLSTHTTKKPSGHSICGPLCGESTDNRRFPQHKRPVINLSWRHQNNNDDDDDEDLLFNNHDKTVNKSNLFWFKVCLEICQLTKLSKPALSPGKHFFSDKTMMLRIKFCSCENEMLYRLNKNACNLRRALSNQTFCISIRMSLLFVP